MTALYRVRVQFNSIEGPPGVATFYFLDLATALPSLTSLFTSLANRMPLGVTLKVQSSGDVIESTTGALIGAWNKDAEPEIGATGGPNYAGASGGQIEWLTSQIMDGRRVRGRTFIVPLSTDAYRTGGLIDSATTDLQGVAAAAFIVAQSSSFVIWHRPFPGRSASAPGVLPKVTAKAAHIGGFALVTGGRVPTKTVVLRSRRD